MFLFLVPVRMRGSPLIPSLLADGPLLPLSAHACIPAKGLNDDE